MRTDVAEQIREAGAGVSKPVVPASLRHPQPQRGGSNLSGSRSATPTQGGTGVSQQQQQQQQQTSQQLHKLLQTPADNHLHAASGQAISPSDSLASCGEIKAAAHAYEAGSHIAKEVDPSSRAAATAAGSSAVGSGGQPRLKQAGSPSGWERLRKAAHVLSRAQFKTSDWANEGHPEEFVLHQV